MMKTLLSVAFVALGFLFANAQTISDKSEKIAYSKEASKAAKKGTLFNAGFFMSDDKTKLYKLSTFAQKKTKVEMLEVQTYDQSGSLMDVEVMPLTNENLAKFKISNFQESSQSTYDQLNQIKVTYIKNPTLAGKPNLVNGTFMLQTNSLGVFTRFKFEKEGSQDLSDKFWAQVYYPQGDQLISRNNFMIQPAPSKKVAREIFKMRNSFMPIENSAYIGGMMATRGSDMFISGIMDLESASWKSKHEIKIPHAFMPGKLNYVQLDNDETGILLPSKKQFTYLQVANDGSEKYMVALSSTKTGGQNGVQPSTYLLKDGKDVVCFATTSKAMTGGDVGLTVSKISNGKEQWSQTFSNKDLNSSAVFPLKEKVKVKKLLMPFIERVEKTKDGGYLVFVEASKNNVNSPEKNYLIIHLSSEGKLLANYALPAVEAPKKAGLVSALPIRIIDAGDSFYAIVRSEVDGYEKGAYTDVSTTSAGDFIYKTTQSYRVDVSQTAGYVVKINTAKKEASNVINIDDMIIGDFPGILSKDGSLFIQSPKEIIVIK